MICNYTDYELTCVFLKRLDKAFLKIEIIFLNKK